MKASRTSTLTPDNGESQTKQPKTAVHRRIIHFQLRPLPAAALALIHLPTPMHDPRIRLPNCLPRTAVTSGRRTSSFSSRCGSRTKCWAWARQRASDDVPEEPEEEARAARHRPGTLRSDPPIRLASLRLHGQNGAEQLGPARDGRFRRDRLQPDPHRADAQDRSRSPRRFRQCVRLRRRVPPTLHDVPIEVASQKGTPSVTRETPVATAAKRWPVYLSATLLGVWILFLLAMAMRG